LIYHSHDGTTNGIAEPCLKPELTHDPEVVNGYIVLSNFIATAATKWSGYNQRLFSDRNRQEAFASKIHNDNVFECMRLSVTDLNSHCSSHQDEHNSWDPAFSAIVGMSVVQRVGGKVVRIGINAQGRKSIDDCLSRTQRYCPLLKLVLNEYAKNPELRKVVSKNLLRGSIGGGLNGFPCVQNHCNMDPMAYYQPFIHYSLQLVSHFGLTFPKTVGLVLAIEVLPNTAYYFSAAAEALLTMDDSKLHCKHRGFAFGYLIASLVLHFYQVRIPVLAYNSTSIGSQNYCRDKSGKTDVLCRCLPILNFMPRSIHWLTKRSEQCNTRNYGNYTAVETILQYNPKL
jgi:hypothetical protein